MRVIGIVLVALGSLAAGCGGSASETPWPIEPVDIEPGPVGEKAPTGDATDIGPAPEPVEETDAGAETDEFESDDEAEEDEAE